jgi:hypothetical protein
VPTTGTTSPARRPTYLRVLRRLPTAYVAFCGVRLFLVPDLSEVAHFVGLVVYFLGR